MFKFSTIIVLFIVGLGIGLLFTLQLKVPPRTNDPISPAVSLNNSTEILNKEKEKLQEAIVKLSQQLNEAQEGIKKDFPDSADLIKELENLRTKAGLVEINDRGVVITLADSPSEPTLDSIVHAADIRDVINFLWKNEAEYISINDQRVVFTTSIDSVINTILINNVKITNPFVIKVAGDSNKLKDALESGGNLQDIHRRQQSSGLIFNIEATRKVTINAFIGGYAINYARVSK